MSAGRCGCRRCDPAAWPESNGWVCEPQRKLKELEAALAAERKLVAELDFARESLWNHYRRCTDALGLRFDEVPENPEKELEMWRGIRAKVTELERDRERLEWWFQNPWHIAYSKDGDDCWLHWAYDYRDEECGPWNGPKGDSPRACIDAAREREVKRS